MPKELKDLKQFLDVCSRSDAKKVKVKKNAENTKFKVRCSRYLYTLVVKDKRKADKMQQSIHSSVQQEVIEKGKKKKN
ncbi:60S ribosomal protein L38 [Diplonema papillatum]|nr:60S ribosomal protein L38 [Diplonema papillatum]